MNRRRLGMGLSAGGLLGAAYYFAGFMLAINPDAPPQKEITGHAPEIPVSTVFVPIDLPLTLVENIAKSAIGNTPVATGTSTELIGAGVIEAFNLPEPKPVCRTERITEAVTKRMQCRDVTKGRNILDGAGRFFECIGRAASTVVLVPVEIVKEVTVCDPVKTVAEAVSPVPELRYEVRLSEMDLTMAGHDVVVRLKLRAALGMGFVGEVFDHLIALHKSKCDVPVSASALVRVAPRVNERQLRLTAQIHQFDFKTKIGKCDGVFAGDLDIRALEQAISGPMGKVIRPKLQSAFQSALDRKLQDPLAPDAVADALAQVDALLAQPVQISQNPLVSLVFDPQSLLLSPRVSTGAGGPKMLRIGAGLQARPQIIALSPPPIPGPSQIAVQMRKGAPDGFTVIPSAKVSLEAVAQTASRVVRAYVNAHAPAFLPDHLEVHVYQSGNRIVLGIEAKSMTWLNVDAKVFLTARPGFDSATNEVTLTDIKFDAASSETLVHRAAWFLEGPIEHLLETKLRFSADEVFQQVIRSLTDFSYSHPAGELKIDLTSLEMQAFWLADNTLNLAVAARGTASLEASLTQLPNQ